MQTSQRTATLPLTGQLETEKAIDLVKSAFSAHLCQQLNLFKVVAPLLVTEDSGINDDLNGFERPVKISLRDMSDQTVSVVQSLAKWKRYRLACLGVEPGEGIITDMKAIRPDETMGPLHSVTVDQWDWEKVITRDHRQLSFLKETVKKIYHSIRMAEQAVFEKYGIEPVLPDRITFIHSEDLFHRYPELTPRQRENEAARMHGAIFLIGIGGELPGGGIHDGRAPDYDDWSTVSNGTYRGLNGDIIVWNPVTQAAFEISSMGIRVDEKSLITQLQIRNCLERKDLMFHRMLLSGRLPLTMGGGIGQSRLCMFMLRKKHIGQVQASIWPGSMTDALSREEIELI
jgi:aspartate--ammonia ligase